MPQQVEVQRGESRVLGDRKRTTQVVAHVALRCGGSASRDHGGLVAVAVSELGGAAGPRGVVVAGLLPRGAPLQAVLRVPLERFQSRSEEHTSELQSLMSTSYAVF